MRFDSHLYAGYNVPPYYDSLLGKLIAHAPTRELAMRRLEAALDELVVDGIKVNVPLHRRILADPGFREGGANIHHLEQRIMA